MFANIKCESSSYAPYDPNCSLDPDYVSDGSDEDWDRDRTTSGEDLDHCTPDCIHYGESANSANESAIPFSMGPLCSKLCNTLLVKKWLLSFLPA